jgi:hypothetical protein
MALLYLSALRRSSDRRAQALYQRLGMREVARHGEGNIKITMRLRPQRRTDLDHISTGLDYCS